MRALSRRTVLRGLGVSLALPWLEAMAPRAAASGGSRRRFVVWSMPSGVPAGQWTPDTTGAGFALTPCLAPLAGVRDAVAVISGLRNLPAVEAGAEEHANCTGTVLTCTAPVALGPDGPRNGVSLDQVLAPQLSAGLPLASLELGGESSSVCSVPWCGGAAHVSWGADGAPRPKETRPERVFARLFTAPGATETEREAALRLLRERSVLDVVRTDALALSARLGHDDRVRLDGYLTGVREIEQRLTIQPLACEALAPEPAPEDVAEQVRQMRDLQVLALRCERTAVATFMVANGRSERSYPFLGFTDPHHFLTHARGPAEQARLTQIVAWMVGEFAGLIAALRDTEDACGASLLESTTALFVSDMGDGAAHTPVDLPVLLAGAGAGAARGQHLAFPERALADLHLTMAQGEGVAISRLGDDGLQALEGLA